MTRFRPRAALAAWWVAALLAIAEGRPVMAEMFDALDDIVRNPAGGLPAVAQALGVSFAPSPASNERFEVVIGGRSRLFPEVKSAEVRIDRRSGRIRLMLLTLDKVSRCVSHEEILRRFGAFAELSVPTPRQPPDSPVYYVYHRSWGDLRIGLSRSKPECVESVVTEFSGTHAQPH
jgi:hypothetical protein